MTDENKPDAGTDPKVKILEINLGELLGIGAARAAPRMSGIELQAATLATITVFKEASESAPRNLEEMLRGAWRSVQDRLLSRPSPGWEIQSAALAEYFQHAGDWGAMRRCLIERGERTQTEAGDFHRRYETHLETARKEYAAQFGSGS